MYPLYNYINIIILKGVGFVYSCGYGCGGFGGEWIWIAIVLFVLLFIVFGNNRCGCGCQNYQSSRCC